MLLADKTQQCLLLRQNIEQLIETGVYAIDDVTILSDKLNKLLNVPIDTQDDVQAYAEFLQQNLDWLQTIMAKLSEQRDAVAESMLTIQKGRRARHSYGQHN